jgi:hypothetical protein
MILSMIPSIAFALATMCAAAAMIRNIDTPL